MTGEQLDKYLKEINQSLDVMAINYPEISASIKSRKTQLHAIEFFTKDFREGTPTKELSPEQNAYVKVAIENLLVDETRAPNHYISYAPMHMEIAKYSLSLSRVCEILGISANIRSLLSKNKPVHISVLKKIADLLECGVDDLIETVEHGEYIRRLEKHAIYRTISKNDDQIDLVELIHEVTGKQDDQENIPRQARRDHRVPPQSSKSIKKIFDDVIENMDDDQRKILRNTVVHSTDNVSLEFINSILEYQDIKQLRLDDYDEFNK